MSRIDYEREQLVRMARRLIGRVRGEPFYLGEFRFRLDYDSKKQLAEGFPAVCCEADAPLIAPVEPDEGLTFAPLEKQIVDALRDGPKCLKELVKATDLSRTTVSLAAKLLKGRNYLVEVKGRMYDLAPWYRRKSAF